MLLWLSWIAVLSLLIINIFFHPTSFFQTGTTLVGWLLLAFQVTINKNENAYILVKRIKYYFTNPDCKWNMVVEYIGDFDTDVFNKFTEIIGESEYKVHNISSTRKLIKVDTITFELSIVDNGKKLNLAVYDLEVSYRRAKNMIDEEIGRYLEKFGSSINKDVDKSTFGINIHFKEFNPYYGLFIKRLKSKEISNFNVVFRIEEDRVSVTKYNIEIYTETIQSLNSLTKKYLKFSPH